MPKQEAVGEGKAPNGASRTGPIVGIVLGALTLVGALLMVMYSRAGAARAHRAIEGTEVHPSQKAQELAEGISQAQSGLGFAVALGGVGLIVLTLSIIRLRKRSKPAGPQAS